MRFVWAGWALALWILFCPAAFAKDTSLVFESGDALNRLCQSFLAVARNDRRGSIQQTYEAGICQGYVGGALDAVSVEKLQKSNLDLPRVCVPNGVDQHTAAEIFAKFLDAHPEQRHVTGYTLVRRALAEAYPCQ